MKAKLVKESLNEFQSNNFLEDIRDALLAGDVYKDAPSRFDPDQQAFYIPYLSSDDKVFFYALIGGGDVYGIESIDQSGKIIEYPEDISGGQYTEEDEIIEIIQELFPSPPQGGRPIGQANSVEEFTHWFRTFGDDEM